MKKKILLFIVLALVLVCAFALSVSAKTVISENNIDESGDIVADAVYKIGDNQYYFSVDITYDDVNGNNKEGKFYYKTSGLYRNKLQLIGVYVPHDFDFSQMVYIFDKSDYNEDGQYSGTEYLKGTDGGNDAMHWHSYKSFDASTGTFSETTVNVKSSITAISYSKYLEYFGHHFMAKAGSLKTVTYNGKEPVEGTVFISPTVTEVMTSTFGGEAEGNINKTSETPKFKRIVFEASTNQVSLGQYPFCRGEVEEIVFLARKYGFRSDSLAYQWIQGTNTPSLKSVVVESGATIATGALNVNVGNYDIVFIGTESEYTQQSGEGKFTSLTNATGNVSYETICYVYGHTDKNDFDCTTRDVCEIAGCNYVLREANASHNQQGTAEFADYYSTVTETVVCTNEGCGHKVVNTLAPIFKFDGYSIKEEESTAICASFSVNSYVLNTYCEGITVGVIGTAFEENEEKTALLNSDGTVSATAGPVIYATIASNCKKVDFKIISNDWSSYGDLELVMALYAYDGSVQYVNGAEDAHSTYTTITYNQVLASQQ